MNGSHNSRTGSGRNLCGITIPCMIKKTLLLLGLGTGILLHATAQPSSRPKIGLTLSGGGAKGLMHIGILEAIDSAGLKIDYLTGTSMGSIIGAMYAAGYSGDTIEKMTRPLDWSLLF